MNESQNRSVFRSFFFGGLAGLLVTAGLCVAALIGARAWVKIKEANEISVTGSARKDVRSDLVIWSVRFSNTAETLAGTQADAKASLAEVLDFMRAAGLGDFTVAPVSVGQEVKKIRDADGAQREVPGGYSIVQRIEVRSADVELVPKLASDTARLIDKGIMLETAGIQFIYTKAGEAKVEMMGEATRDARTRASQIAAQGGRKIKALSSARMGVVQINPRYSTATSWEGNNDTSSVEKTITTTVTASFSLE
jgi:hypothetical protein